MQFVFRRITAGSVISRCQILDESRNCRFPFVADMEVCQPCSAYPLGSGLSSTIIASGKY